MSFPTNPTALPEPSTATTTAPPSKSVDAGGVGLLLGRGVTRPLQRDGKGDFVNVSDERLVRAAVGQILGTVAQNAVSAGELPWRPEFGSRLHLLRHRSDGALEDVARAFVVQALERWEPRVRVRAVSIVREGTPTNADQNILRIRVRYDLTKTPGGSILLRGIDQTITITAG